MIQAEDGAVAEAITQEARWPTIQRASGVTTSEQYLAKIADKSFLNLWSYPNLFIDKKPDAKGDGKELCDLLVVCGDHVLIFSDKTIAWPATEDEGLAWKRWYKRAILKSFKQIRGAERWITDFPERIFLDQQCTQPFPLLFPPPERRKVHGIVVALGSSEACKEYFNEGIGSFYIAPNIKGEAHFEGERVLPFMVGDVDPNGSFVHVLDDATFDIVMRELDTIDDFTRYLIKKEHLIRNKNLLAAAGEEELVAYYMTHINSVGQHDFTQEDGSDFGQKQSIVIDVGLYDELIKSTQYQNKIKADRISYLWDDLIKVFTENMLAGTSIVPDGQLFNLCRLEEAVRQMALVPRFIRRSLGAGIMDALEKGGSTDRFTRGFLPGPNDSKRDTAFFFMTLRTPKVKLKGGYEQYRDVRRQMLATYAFGMLKDNQNLQQIVGIAAEPQSDISDSDSSEDLIMARQPEWTPELIDSLEEKKKNFSMFQPDSYVEYPIQDSEFPEPNIEPASEITHNTNRAGRRAKAAQVKRLTRKRRKTGR